MRLAEIESLLDRVHEVGLEAVEWLDGELDPARRAVLGRASETVGSTAQLGLSLRRLQQSGLAGRGVHGPGHVRGADCRRKVDAVLNIGQSVLADIGIGMREVAIGSERAADPDRQPRAVGVVDEDTSGDESGILDAHLDHVISERRGAVERRGGGGIRERRREDEGAEPEPARHDSRSSRTMVFVCVMAASLYSSRNSGAPAPESTPQTSPAAGSSSYEIQPV